MHTRGFSRGDRPGSDSEKPCLTGVLEWPGVELVAKQTRVGLWRGEDVNHRHEDFQSSYGVVLTGTSVHQ